MRTRDLINVPERLIRRQVGMFRRLWRRGWSFGAELFSKFVRFFGFLLSFSWSLVRLDRIAHCGCCHDVFEALEELRYVGVYAVLVGVWVSIGLIGEVD